MKFELQQTFHIKRRLARWVDNDFGNNKTELDKQLTKRAVPN